MKFLLIIFSLLFIGCESSHEIPSKKTETNIKSIKVMAIQNIGDGQILKVVRISYPLTRGIRQIYIVYDSTHLAITK